MKLRCLNCVHSTLPYPHVGTGAQLPGTQNISQRPSSLPARTSIVGVSKVLSPEVKRPGRKDYYPTPYYIEVKTTWRYTSTPPPLYVLML